MTSPNLSMTINIIVVNKLNSLGKAERRLEPFEKYKSQQIIRYTKEQKDIQCEIGQNYNIDDKKF